MRIFYGWWVVVASSVGLSTNPGQFAFGAPWTLRVAAMVVAALALVAVTTYLRVRTRGGPRERMLLVGVQHDFAERIDLGFGAIQERRKAKLRQLLED